MVSTLEEGGGATTQEGRVWAPYREGQEQLILVFALHCAPARGLRERALETFLSMFLETFGEIRAKRVKNQNNVLDVNVRIEI